MSDSKNKQFIENICIFAREIIEYVLAFALIYNLTLDRKI
ncbi:hypothetical protein ACINWC743_1620 [Acinetobacter sp. WC-743]|nr:hypothetical protein ACINWC743_1620 [Acinetobacter sp. WC-743]